MTCFVLKNYHKKFNIKKHEYLDFKQCVLKALQSVEMIYLFTLNSSNCNEMFLAEILNILIERRYHNDEYGPLILDMQNIPIKDVGIESICKYLQQNCKGTKWIRIGQIYGGYQIPTKLVERLIESLESNFYVLKLDIEIPGRNFQYSAALDKIIKRNERKYREEKRKRRKMTV